MLLICVVCFFDYLISRGGSRGSYLNNKLIDHDQADHHGDIGQQGEDGQDPEIPDKNQQHQEGQEGEHVESRVHGGCQNHRLIVVAVVGGHISRFYHLEWEEDKKRKRPLKTQRPVDLPPQRVSD